MKNAGRLNSFGVVYPFLEVATFKLAGRSEGYLGRRVGSLVVVVGGVGVSGLVTYDVEYATNT